MTPLAIWCMLWGSRSLPPMTRALYRIDLITRERVGRRWVTNERTLLSGIANAGEAARERDAAARLYPDALVVSTGYMPR